MVASMLNFADKVIDFVPSALCAMFPLVTLPSFVVLPPLLETDADVQVDFVPLMVASLSVLELMFRLQELACTR